ncbi:hypothetical protein Ddc_11112 [Ditylenchus destructor]|nr:hypothetical protein Ddc_11112 [Ditylenchus destructor]
MKTLVSFNKFGRASVTNNNSDEDHVVILPGDTVSVNLEADHKTKFALGQWFGGKMEGLWPLGMLTMFLIGAVMSLVVYGDQFFNQINSVIFVVCYIIEMLLYCYVEIDFWKAYKNMVRQNASQ